MSLRADQSGERLFYFRKRFHATRQSLRGLLLTTPWIDMVLLFILFLITQSSFVVQPGVTLELPVGPASGHARYGDWVVTIPQEGMYFFNDERMAPAALAAALARVAAEQPGRAVIVEADARISYRTLMDVYAMAVEAGVPQVLMATRSPTAP